MPNTFQQFQRMSFDGLEFPYKHYEISCSLRYHVHEYPHTAGGDPEKLGRKPYEIRVTPIVQAGLLPPRYALLFPERLQRLRALFEQQATRELVIPHLGGAIKCFAISWNEKVTASNLSGVEPEWVFLEDQSGLFGADFVLLTNQLRSKLENWTIEATRLPETPDIFTQINNAALEVLSIKDQLDLFGGLVAAKIEGLVGLIREADSQLESLRDPDNYPILESLHRLLLATIDLGRDVAGKGKELRVWTVPRTMSVTQVSIALYGDSTHAVEIMQLNTLDTPLAIPAGTKIIYYA